MKQAPVNTDGHPQRRDTIRMIVRGSLGSCSSSSECEYSSASSGEGGLQVKGNVIPKPEAACH